MPNTEELTFAHDGVIHLSAGSVFTQHTMFNSKGQDTGDRVWTLAEMGFAVPKQLRPSSPWHTTLGRCPGA